MANFYTDHPEIKFNLESSPLMQRIVELKENGFADKDNFDYAPEDFADAMDNYNRVLEVAGDITANTVFPNSEDVDAEGPHCENGRVRYASKTYENLQRCHDAAPLWRPQLPDYRLHGHQRNDCLCRRRFREHLVPPGLH